MKPWYIALLSLTGGIKAAECRVKVAESSFRLSSNLTDLLWRERMRVEPTEDAINAPQRIANPLVVSIVEEYNGNNLCKVVKLVI